MIFKRSNLTFPNRRPDFPRRSSRESGFFFWGIILDPVLLKAMNQQAIVHSRPTYLYASLKVINPNSAVEYMIKSSAILLICVITKLDHIKNSAMKSRSATPQRLFSATERNPNSFARNSLSTTNGLPANAPLPRGKTEIRGIS